MRLLALALLAPLVGCVPHAASTPPTTAAAVPVSCVPIYLFEFQILDEKGLLRSKGVAQVDTHGCETGKTEPRLVEGEPSLFSVDPTDPTHAKFEALLGGERIEAYAPVIPNLRIVVEERVRANRAGFVLLTVTPFASQEVLRQTIKERFARAGMDVTQTAAPSDAARPAAPNSTGEQPLRD